MTDLPEIAEQRIAIDLRWAQKVAASWAIYWPSWIASFVPAFFAPVELTNRDLAIFFVASTGIRFIIQAILCRRLIRKNYLSFYVGVVREGEQEPGRTLLPGEHFQFGCQFLLPQIILTFLLGLFYLALPLESASALRALADLAVVFVINPAALSWALSRNYRGFRLQAYLRKGRRDSAWSSLRNLEE